MKQKTAEFLTKLSILMTEYNVEFGVFELMGGGSILEIDIGGNGCSEMVDIEGQFISSAMVKNMIYGVEE